MGFVGSVRPLWASLVVVLLLVPAGALAKGGEGGGNNGGNGHGTASDGNRESGKSSQSKPGHGAADSNSEKEEKVAGNAAPTKNESAKADTPSLSNDKGESSKKDEARSSAAVEVRKSHDLTHTLRVRKVGDGHALRWVATDAETQGYQIWRSNSPFALVATLPAEATTYVDAAAPAESKYKVTYFTERAMEQGYVATDAAPADLPEWNPDVFVAASLESPIVIPSSRGTASFWIALAEGFLLLGGVSFAVARPELSARAFAGARSRVLRFTAQFTLSVIVFGEALEHRLGVRLLGRFNDPEILDLFAFMMQPAAAPLPLPLPPPAPLEAPRLSVSRLFLPEAAQQPD